LICLIVSHQEHQTHQIKQKNEWELEERKKIISSIKSMKSASKQATILLNNTYVMLDGNIRRTQEGDF